MRRRAVITGMGILTALGTGKEANLSGVIEGSSGIALITSFDTTGYRVRTGGEVKDPEISRPATGKLARHDRATRLLLAAAAEAMAEASVARGLPEETPVFAGTTLGGMIGGVAYHRALMAGGRPRPALIMDYLSHLQAAHLRDRLGLKGEISTVSNACASGANAIGFAFKEIQSGCAEAAIAAGYDTMCEFTYAGFNSLQALSPTVTRPFDRDRDGLALGEGGAVFVMEELGRAKARGARIIAEVIGYGESTDAYHITRPDPSGAGAARAMQMAIVDAGVDPADIDYINAHGTGTPPNDSMEAAAIKTVFGPHASRVPVSSTKPMTGHLLGGAGAVEAAISIMAMNAGVLPPNLNYRTPEPGFNLNVIDRPGERAVIKTILSNSFGFGGANAALVIRRYGDHAS
ncbi:MAG: beta-ketoacyl-[acyl-carrier-protein] synthase family protein [Deltaproteobacteria bacterium]|nr:beta-ketoacyl-[acyl-carrier-protein] synthase family protein [Deltaproteobacteria bacterium]